MFLHTSFSLKQCVDIFGDKFNESSISRGIGWTNDNYGGYSMNAKRVSLKPIVTLSSLLQHTNIVATYLDYCIIQHFKLGLNHFQIVFPNGSIDPWHALSFIENREDMVSVFIKGGYF